MFVKDVEMYLVSFDKNDKFIELKISTYAIQ